MELSTRGKLAETFLYPKSIAIVGASPTESGWSYRAFVNLKLTEYPGKIFPINPRYTEVWDVPCYPDLTALPEVPDQLVVIVAAERCLPLMTEAVALGTRSAIVYAGGFGEDQTAEGAARGMQLRELVESSGFALCGPNCLGYASFPARLSVLTAPAGVRTDGGGTIGIVAQSGGVALALNRKLSENGVQPRYVISSGNEIGLSVEDYLELFVEDPGVEAIALFIETLKDPARFLSLCQLAADRNKPIVASKIGTSPEAQKAAVAHTGRLAGSGKVFADIVSASGVIMVRTVDEMIDVLATYRPGRLPRSRRLGAVTVSGGLRSIFLDSASHWGMEFPTLEPKTLEILKSYMGVGTAVGNPVDSGWSGLQDQGVIINSARDLARDPNTDAVIVQRIPDANLAAQLEEISKETSKPMVFPGGVFFSTDLPADAQPALVESTGVSHSGSADRAIMALRKLADYSIWLQNRSTSTTSPTASKTNAETSSSDSPLSRMLKESAENQSQLLDEDQAKSLMEQYGLRTPRRRAVTSAEDAQSVFSELGGPAILKVVSEHIAHKSVLGLLSVLLFNSETVRSEYERIEKRCEELGDGARDSEIWIEEAIVGGIECAVGISRDAEFGLVMMFGTGGAGLEVFNDVAFAMPIRDEQSARALIAKTRIGTVLLKDEQSPSSRYDLDALIAVLIGVGKFASDSRDKLEALDLNPVSVCESGRGAILLDASVQLS